MALAVHDGFYSCGTGAGLCNRALLEVLVELLPVHTKLLVLPIWLDPSHAGYDSGWHSDMQAMVDRVGGDVLPVDNGSNGQSRFGNLAHLRRASARAADALLKHRPRDGARCLILAVDVPFFGVGVHLPPDMSRGLVVIAQGTAAVHAPNDTQRLEWEGGALRASVTAGARIAATSAAMRRSLVDTYAIGDGAVVDLPNGLTARERIPAPLCEAPSLPPAARAGFVLAMGRAEAHKGFDDLLDAVRLLSTDGTAVPHLVIAAVTDGELNDYQRHLAYRIRVEGIDATLWTRFSHGLRGLLGHPALRAVVVPSRVEPFGRIPLEAYVAGAAPLVATTAGGLAELVRDGHTGYVASPHHPAGLAGALRRALNTDEAGRHRMRETGRRLAARYDYPRTVRDFLGEVAPWLATSPHATKAI
ncbi:MAG: glycosyltransferase family 4 protein [Micromonosporaceae bacterium]